MRAATMEEIVATARRLLVEQGPDAASLRAIAREMGMTAPGLYRYFSSREELLRHVIALMFKELSGDIRRAMDEAAPVPGGRPGRGGHSDERSIKLGTQLVAACREFRRWGLGHQAEFALLFGVPLPGLEEDEFDIAQQCAVEFAWTFYALFVELLQATGVQVPDPAEMDESLLQQVGRFRDKLRAEAPEGAILIFLRCWVLLYGAVSMEVFGHLRFAIDDPAPMFEFTLADLARLVGLEYPLPTVSEVNQP
jgi:AcrR family transcriptional regulator